MPNPTRASGGLRRYFEESRNLGLSFVLVLPLFLLYQAGVLATGGVHNGVDFMTSTMMAITGGSLGEYLLLNASILVGFMVAIAVLKRRGALHTKYIPWMLAEASVYALLFGSVVVGLIRTLGLGALLAAGAGGFHPGLLDKIVLSCGAGLYEELVFRLFLMGGLFALFTRGLGQKRPIAAFVAVVLSSLIFSAVHHLGNMGEPFTLSAFTYRVFCGVVLATIFQFRGFAIAAYTHALYDIIVMVFKDG